MLSELLEEEYVNEASFKMNLVIMQISLIYLRYNDGFVLRAKWFLHLQDAVPFSFFFFFKPISLLYVIFWMDQERMKFQLAEYTTKYKKSNAGVFGDKFSG